MIKRGQFNESLLVHLVRHDIGEQFVGRGVAQALPEHFVLLSHQLPVTTSIHHAVRVARAAVFPAEPEAPAPHSRAVDVVVVVLVVVEGAEGGVEEREETVFRTVDVVGVKVEAVA